MILVAKADQEFLNHPLLTELGFAAGFALWGFRSCARGQERCCVIAQGFQRMFGADAPLAVGGLLALARILGADGRRKIRLASPGCVRLTSDELSVVAALAAAQAGDEPRLEAHLSWLLACAPEPRACVAAWRTGQVFADAGMKIEAPELDITPPLAAHTFVVHEGGRA